MKIKFHVGQKVICIDGRPWGTFWCAIPGPQQDEELTIMAIREDFLAFEKYLPWDYAPEYFKAFES